LKWLISRLRWEADGQTEDASPPFATLGPESLPSKP
jgi:hypothetical protein